MLITLVLTLLAQAVERQPVSLKPVDGVVAARELLERPYEWGGRLREHEGIDCLGVVLAAAERVSGCGWRSFSVNPTDLVNSRALGAPVEVASGVLSAQLEISLLQPGDVVMLMSPVENPSEPALTKVGGVPMWVWHVGIASSGGRWVVGDHHAGKVIETGLHDSLRANADEYAAVYVGRPTGQRPKVCRKHPPMGARHRPAQGEK